MTQKKLAEALQMSAFLIDADNAGYLGVEDANNVQKIKIDYGSICQAIILQNLKASADPIAAKSMIKDELLQLKNSVAQNGFEDDDTAIFGHLEDQLFETLEREQSKPEWRRQLSRFALFIPTLFRWLVGAVIIGVLAYGAVSALSL